MFPTRYFCNRYFAPRYFPKGGANPLSQLFWNALTGLSALTGGGMIGDEEWPES